VFWNVSEPKEKNYVVHGGTNFGYSADNINMDKELDVLALNGHQAVPTSRSPIDASYDYSAPIGEAAQFHNFYAPARQAAFADTTWLVQDRIIVGPSFVKEDGTIEFPSEGGKATVYAATGKSVVEANEIEVEPLPKLTNWFWRDATAEKSINYPEDKWLESHGPQRCNGMTVSRITMAGIGRSYGPPRPRRSTCK
jgi:hypothetical protein